MKRCLAALLVSTTLVANLPARPAWSQDNLAKKEGTARLKAGLAYANQGKWEQARLSFLQAYAVVPTADVLWNLAFAELKAGHALEALDHFDAYESERKADPAKLAALHDFRARAYQQIGRLKVQAPPGARVWVDGGKQVATEAANVAPGEHRVRVEVGEAGAEHSEERQLTIQAGQVLEVPFAFPERKPAPVAEPVLASSPPSQNEPVTFETAGPSPSARPNLTLGWIGVATTGVAVGLGVGFALAASSKTNDVEAARSSASPFTCSANPMLQVCSDVQDAISKHDIYTKISTVSFVAAGVFGVASVGYLLIASRKSTVAMAPYATAHEGGLWIRGGF